MNQFGKILRLSIFGESHGEVIGITLDGVPPGIHINEKDFEKDIERRRPGKIGTTPRVEADEVRIVTGLFNEHSTGAPMTLLFENKNTRSGDYAEFRKFPRPGHADYVAEKKYLGFQDFRGGGHFSGRLTVLLVAAGVIAKKILGEIRVQAEIVEIAGEMDPEVGLQKAIQKKDTVGGIVECVISGVPVGLGEPFFDSLESVISHAVFSVPAIKAIEFGAGFASARMFGSEHNDPIINLEGKTASNHAGGIVGGISNGNNIVFRVAVKPTSSTPKVQQTLNIESGLVEPFKVKGRHDLCIALRAPVVIEAAAALAVADMFLQSKRY
jgi:chorismate synthase